MSDLLLNARFLMRHSTGVDRVAAELMCALDRLGLPDGLNNWRALLPAGQIAYPEKAPPEITQRMAPTLSRLDGHLWEQLILGRSEPDNWLISLCNTGPILRRKHIVMLHDAQVFRQPESYSRIFRTFYRTLQPHLGRRAAMVLTVSEHSKNELEHFGVVPEGKVRVVPNGADHILRTPADLRILTRHNLKPQGYFLAIGSQAPHKNLSLLALAASSRTDTSKPLIFAGEGSAAAFARANIKATDDIRHTGRVTDAELRALYENASALAFPSLTEGFGLPPLEAMLCGCPVIASTGGAIPETCHTAAYYVDPLDLDGWTKALDHIDTNSDVSARLRAAGYKRAAAFTWANAAAILAGYLAELPKDEPLRQGVKSGRDSIDDPIH